MGYKLRREVRDLLWAGALTPSERVLLLELADNANDGTREAFPGMDWILANCDVPTKKRVGEHLASIAAKWFEIRVEVGKDKNGNPLYAMPKKRTTYRFPTRAELVARHGDSKVPEIRGLDACKVPENQGPKVPEIRGAEGPKVPEIQGPFSSLSSSPQKISSSLSPREDETPTASAVPAPRTERENEDASQPEPENPVTRILLDAGCPTNQLDDVREELTRRHQPRSPAWWRTVSTNGDLPGLVAEVLDALQPITRTMTTTEWKAAVADQPACEHHEPGGNLPRHGDGWMHCAFCRKLTGWTEKNVQPRTEERSSPRKRSTGALRAEQGLAVADELDRQFGHGRYATGGQQPYRNPTDMSVYEDWSVLGGPSPGASIRRGGTRLRLTDSRNPDRDYDENF